MYKLHRMLKTLKNKHLSFILAIIAVLFAEKKGFSQEEPRERPFKKIHVEYSFLLIPSNFIFHQSRYTNFTTGINIFTKFSEQWIGGLSTYSLLLVPSGGDIRTSQGYHISGLFARYYPPNYFMKYYVEPHLGTGSICVCTSNTKYSSGGIVRLEPFEGWYLGAGIGFEIQLTSHITMKPNVKAFYLLNDAPDKELHVRPFLTFLFKPYLEMSPIIYNPRF